MNLTIDRKSLKDALDTMKRVAPVHCSLPVLRHVLLEATEGTLRLHATDLEVSAEVTLPACVTRHGAITVPALELWKAVGRGGDTLTLSAEEARGEAPPYLEVTNGGASLRLSGITAEDFPAPPSVVPTLTLVLPQAAMRTLIGRVIAAASKDETHPILTGVCIEVAPEYIRFIATDTHRVAVASRSMDIGPAAAPDKDGNPRQVLVTAASLRLLERLLTAPNEAVRLEVAPLVVEGPRGAFEDGGEAAFTVGNTRIVTRLIPGKFPRYHRVIPTGHTSRVIVAADPFLAAVRAAATVAKDAAAAHRVYLRVQEGRLVVAAKDSNGGRAREAVAAELNGPPLDIAFNAQYLITALQALGAPAVTLGLSKELSPASMWAAGPGAYAGNEQDVTVIMPMQNDGSPLDEEQPATEPAPVPEPPTDNNTDPAPAEEPATEEEPMPRKPHKTAQAPAQAAPAAPPANGNGGPKVIRIVPGGDDGRYLTSGQMAEWAGLVLARPPVRGRLTFAPASLARVKGNLEAAGYVVEVAGAEFEEAPVQHADPAAIAAAVAQGEEAATADGSVDARNRAGINAAHARAAAQEAQDREARQQEAVPFAIPVPEKTVFVNAASAATCGALLEAAARGYVVVNAPRPLAGNLLWKDRFRHGTFYAAGRPEEFGATWERNDAWPVRVVTNAEIAAAIVARGATVDYEIDPKDMPKLAKSYGLPWSAEEGAAEKLPAEAPLAGMGLEDTVPGENGVPAAPYPFVPDGDTVTEGGEPMGVGACDTDPRDPGEEDEEGEVSDSLGDDAPEWGRTYHPCAECGREMEDNICPVCGTNDGQPSDPGESEHSCCDGCNGQFLTQEGALCGAVKGKKDSGQFLCPSCADEWLEAQAGDTTPSLEAAAGAAGIPVDTAEAWQPPFAVAPGDWVRRDGYGPAEVRTTDREGIWIRGARGIPQRWEWTSQSLRKLDFHLPDADASPQDLAAALRAFPGGREHPSRVQMAQRLGALVVPGLRLQDCEPAAAVWMAVQEGTAEMTEWTAYVEQLHRENRVAAPPSSREPQEGASGEAEAASAPEPDPTPTLPARQEVAVSQIRDTGAAPDMTAAELVAAEARIDNTIEAVEQAARDLEDIRDRRGYLQAVDPDTGLPFTRFDTYVARRFPRLGDRRGAHRLIEQGKVYRTLREAGVEPPAAGTQAEELRALPPAQQPEAMQAAREQAAAAGERVTAKHVRAEVEARTGRSRKPKAEPAPTSEPKGPESEAGGAPTQEAAPPQAPEGPGATSERPTLTVVEGGAAAGVGAAADGEEVPAPPSLRSQAPGSAQEEDTPAAPAPTPAVNPPELQPAAAAAVGDGAPSYTEDALWLAEEAQWFAERAMTLRDALAVARQVVEGAEGAGMSVDTILGMLRPKSKK